MQRSAPPESEAAARSFGPLHDAVDIDAEQLAALAETEALDKVLDLLRRELDLS
jgi:hypothetical protein